MFKKMTLGVLAAATAFTALPAAAEAAPRRGYYDNGYYSQSYRGDRYDRYSRNDRYGGYDRRYANRSYQGRYNSQRCDKGTTGTIVGAIAGGLLGHEVAGRGDRAVGAIIGGAAGALAGRAIDKNSGGNRC
ncbi:glycine zipper 2TM domain-containing protein [Allosphingosinicella vermicomposti]|uniref:glycine zipper 2TM domain-containing protein n=1 Tax=Allosphingosinicella vermicomposti TaxID=614671 RepID=UPI000D1051AC|nr:glycine zipper 2TM domain-containing protein [Allosphingosinicella vermicomposti]